VRLPIEPQSAGTMMNMISSKNNVNRGVHLDAVNLGTKKILSSVTIPFGLG